MSAPATTHAGSTRAALVLPSLIYLCVGIAHVYWGTVSAQAPALRSASTLGLLVSSQFAGFLVGVLAAPALGRLVGVRRQIAAALALFALALSTPAWIDVLPGLIAAGCLFGLAAGTLETQVGSLALQAADGARALTVLEVFFGLGAVTFPLYLVIAGRLVSWRVLVALVAVGVLALFLAWLLRPPRWTPAVHDAPERTPGEPARRLPSPIALLMLVFVLFYAGFETNFANFLPAIVGADGASAQGVVAVSAFWTGITVGRLAATRAAESLMTLRTLAALATLLAVILLACRVLVDGGSWPLLVAVLFAGLLAAGIFPGALVLCARVGGVPTPTMTSYFVACASLGGSVMAVPVGWSLNLGGARSALTLLAGFAVVLVLLAALAGLMRPRRNATDADARMASGRRTSKTVD